MDKNLVESSDLLVQIHLFDSYHSVDVVLELLDPLFQYVVYQSSDMNLCWTSRLLGWSAVLRRNTIHSIFPHKFHRSTRLVRCEDDRRLLLLL